MGSTGTKVFKTGGTNVAAPSWKIDGLIPRGENQGERFGTRHGLRDALDRQQISTSASLSDVQGMDRFYDQVVYRWPSNSVSDISWIGTDSDSVIAHSLPAHYLHSFILVGISRSQ